MSCQPTPRLFLSPIIALFLSSFSFLCIWCKTKPFTFPIPSLPVLLSLPLFSTYSLNQDVVGTDMYINSLTMTRNQGMHLEAFSSFLSLFVYLPLGPTSYLSQSPYLHYLGKVAGSIVFLVARQVKGGFDNDNTKFAET